MNLSRTNTISEIFFAFPPPTSAKLYHRHTRLVTINHKCAVLPMYSHLPIFGISASHIIRFHWEREGKQPVQVASESFTWHATSILSWYSAGVSVTLAPTPHTLHCPQIRSLFRFERWWCHNVMLNMYTERGERYSRDGLKMSQWATHRTLSQWRRWTRLRFTLGIWALS